MEDFKTIKAMGQLKCLAGKTLRSGLVGIVRNIGNFWLKFFHEGYATLSGRGIFLLQVLTQKEIFLLLWVILFWTSKSMVKRVCLGGNKFGTSSLG